MPARPERALAVFDVCGTLFDANTTVAFLTYLGRQGTAPSFAARNWLVRSRRSPACYLLWAVHRFARLDWGRAILVASLAGLSPDMVRDMARKFVETELGAATIPSTMAELHRHKAAGDRVILLSNSLAPVIAAIAESLGVEWAATELEESGGVLTGRILRDLTGRKHLALERLLQNDAANYELFVYTDNASDRPLLERADRPFVIRRKTDRHRAWRGLNAQFLEL